MLCKGEGTQGIQCRMVFGGQFFFEFFKIIFWGFVDAIFDLVHDVEPIFHLPYVLTTSGNFCLNMSDAHETAICSFTGISHISEKISRCCWQLT